MTRPAHPRPAQLATIRNGALSPASATASATCSASVTSVATAFAAPPRFSASALPPSAWRSPMRTPARAPASRRAQASPSPEAPPVMSAPTPEICIGSASKPIAQLILQDLHGGIARKLVDHLELLWDLLHHQSCVAAVLLHL